MEIQSERVELSAIGRFLKLIWAIIVLISLLFFEFFLWVVNICIPTRQKKIDGKLALVTGGGNGIGRSIVFELAKKGCNIAIADIDFDMAEKTAKEVNKLYSVKTKAFKTDVSDYNAILQLKKEIENSLGYVDLLVNNAGLICFNISLTEKQPEDIQKVIQVNLMSQLWTVRAFLDGMIERKYGHIASVCSFAGKIPFPLSCVYTASKFGVTGFMNALYDNLCINNLDEFIKTTTVYPSFTGTYEIIKENVPDDVHVLSSQEVAEDLVQGILTNKRSVYCPKFMKLALILNDVPDRVRRLSIRSKYTQETIEKNKIMGNHVITRDTTYNSLLSVKTNC